MNPLYLVRIHAKVSGSDWVGFMSEAGKAVEFDDLPEAKKYANMLATPAWFNYAGDTFERMEDVVIVEAYVVQVSNLAWLDIAN